MNIRLLKLIESVPNWETYLTAKQLQAVEEYIKCLNTYEVDYKLNLSAGTAQQRIFGNNSNKGAIGRLEQAAEKLYKQGYFKNTKVKSKSTISDKTKEDIKELIKIIVDNPDYEHYLDSIQKEIIFQFLRLRSINQCAKYFNISESIFNEYLIDILNQLKNNVKAKTVNKWEDI